MRNLPKEKGIPFRQYQFLNLRFIFGVSQSTVDNIIGPLPVIAISSASVTMTDCFSILSTNSLVFAISLCHGVVAIGLRMTIVEHHTSNPLNWQRKRPHIVPLWYGITGKVDGVCLRRGPSISMNKPLTLRTIIFINPRLSTSPQGYMTTATCRNDDVAIWRCNIESQ